MTTSRSTSRLTRTLLALAFALGAIAGPVPATPTAYAGGGLVPDLAVAPLTDFRIETVNGRRLLRFTAMMVNVGAGHFEVRGRRASSADPMVMRQILWATTSRTGNIAQEITTDAVGKWSGDGHDHWHVQEMMRYDLWGGPGTFRGDKVGFCFLDSDPYRLSLPGSPSGSYYRGSWCGTSKTTLNTRMGVSVGWGDKYGWNLAYQWVDITGLPGGTYTLRSKVDPYGYFTEQQEGNNCAYARVSFSSSSNAVTVHSRDDVCVDDWSSSPFAGNIQWAYSQDITFGCSPDMFCTNNAVSREQMASFLVRALDLAAAPADPFIDDEGSIHEPNINRIAAAGITGGCGPDRYCPRAVVSRAQMASFLVRAFDLPRASRDYFTDDSASIHEADINSVAEAGIAFGCAEGSFCPRSPVRRGQMAAFLHRAMGS